MSKTPFRPWTISLRLLLTVSTVAGLLLAWGIQRNSDQVQAQREIVPATWDITTGENVLWRTRIGSQTYSSPVVGNGKVFVGSNNDASFDPRYPKNVDMGVMLCFDAVTGKFIWQHASPKLKTGRVNDWPLQGVCATATVENDRLWYMSNRAEIFCLDTEGFLDGQNDGVQNEPSKLKTDADIVWQRDLIADYGVFPHNMSCGGCEILGNRLFFVAPNGVDEGHLDLPAPNAPSFMCLDKRTGGLLWKDHSSSAFIVHGQWGTPAAARLGGVDQVLFPGGDGWLYSFAAAGDGRGGAKLLWKFDCNPKNSMWRLGGRGTRSNLVQAPTIYQGKVYIAVGQDPEHGDGPGRLLCIDPTRRGDVSAELVMRRTVRGNEVAPRRRQAPVRNPEDRSTTLREDEFVMPNSNSALVWVYTGAKDQNPKSYATATDPSEIAALQEDQGEGAPLAPVPGSGDRFHRSISRIAARDNLIFAADIAGFFHCLDARTGQVKWVHDLFASTWSSPVIAGKHVYLGNEDGMVIVYRLSGDPAVALNLGTPHAELEMPDSIYSTPIVHNNVMYFSTRKEIIAIQEK